MAIKGSQEWHKNISDGRKRNPTLGPRYWLGKKHDDEYKRKMSLALSGKNNPRYGIKLNKELKEKISTAIKAHYKINGTDKLKGERPQTSIALKGHFVSEATKRKIAIKASGKIGKINPNWKGGKSKCKDCGNETKVWHAKRCKKCQLIYLYTKENLSRIIGNRPRPSKLELKIEGVIKKYNLPYKFVGDGKFFIERKCPDFININGEKIAIEAYYKRHKDKFNGSCNSWMNERKRIFSKYGWQIIFIEGQDLTEDKILNTCKAKISDN